MDTAQKQVPSMAFFMPAHNEGGNLEGVVTDAVKCLTSEGYDFTVIVVDDGSTDNTIEVCDDLRDRYGAAVRHVRHEQNQGYGAALRTGFKAGLATGHEWIAFCDSDGQFKPGQVLDLVDSATSHQADIVIGHRIQRADSLKRRFMGRAWHVLSRLVLGYRALDVDCGFKLFSRTALEDLEPRLIGEHATISPEILYCARRLGHQVTEVGVEHFERKYGEQSGDGLRVIVSSLIGLLNLRYQHRNSFLRG